MTRMFTLLAAVSLTAVISGTAIAAPATGPVRNVVLVHGAFADGSGWKAVAEILRKDGYAVSVVQQPLTSLVDDVAATNRILNRQSGPAVLVGHSYGGAVIPGWQQSTCRKPGVCRSLRPRRRGESGRTGGHHPGGRDQHRTHG